MPSQAVVEFEGERFLVVGRFHFYVESRSEPGSWHALDLEGVEGEDGHCTCRSGTTRKWCRHEDVVLRWLKLTSSPDSGNIPSTKEAS